MVCFPDFSSSGDAVNLFHFNIYKNKSVSFPGLYALQKCLSIRKYIRINPDSHTLAFF